MRIIELRTENIKNLKVVEIRPGNDAVIISGRNGAGKSAVLDSLYMALTGKKLEQPIRDGQSRAEVEVDLGDYRVKKVFTAKGERLEVLSKSGDVKRSPQTFLDGILGNLTFDPLQFASQDAKAQRKTLADIVGLNFAGLDEDRLAAYNERTTLYRRQKGLDPTAALKGAEGAVPLQKLVTGIEPPAEGTPRIEISMADELAKVEAFEAKARVHQKWQLEVDEQFEYAEKCSADIGGKQDEISQLEERIKALEHDIEILEQNRTNALESGKELLEPENVSDEQISAAKISLRDVEQKNIAIRNAIKYDEAMAALRQVNLEITGLTRKIEDVDEKKRKMVEQAAFPIPGLGLTDEYVTFQDKPFGQLSTGEQIRVSTSVAMALNPTLRIILIREGSLLDNDGLKAIIALAKEKDYQLWIEKVADDKGVGIYIEQGEITK